MKLSVFSLFIKLIFSLSQQDLQRKSEVVEEKHSGPVGRVLNQKSWIILSVIKFDKLPRPPDVVHSRVIVHAVAPDGQAPHVGPALGHEPDEHATREHVAVSVRAGAGVVVRMHRVVGKVGAVAVELAPAAVDLAAAAPVEVLLGYLLDAVERGAVEQETVRDRLVVGLVQGQQVLLRLVVTLPLKRVLDPVNLQRQESK